MLQGVSANKRLWDPHGGFHTARSRRWACGAPPPAGNGSGEVDDLASLREARVSRFILKLNFVVLGTLQVFAVLSELLHCARECGILACDLFETKDKFSGTTPS
jgi:hypothetical protein